MLHLHIHHNRVIQTSLNERQNRKFGPSLRELSNKSLLVCRTLEPTLKVGWNVWDLLFSLLKSRENLRGLKHGMHVGLGILNATLACIIEGGALNCSELYKCDIRKGKGCNKPKRLVCSGKRVIPYCLYQPRTKKARQGVEETISLQALFICLCSTLIDFQ